MVLLLKSLLNAVIEYLKSVILKENPEHYINVCAPIVQSRKSNAHIDSIFSV